MTGALPVGEDDVISGELIARDNDPHVRDAAEELTPEVVHKLAAHGLTLYQIADYFGVDHVTLDALMRVDPAIKKAFRRGRAHGLALVSTRLMRQVNEGNIAATIFYLRSRGGWVEGIDLTHVKAFGGDPEKAGGENSSKGYGVLVVPQDALTVEEWEKRQQERLRARGTDPTATP
jgi:hypothetical protein